MTLKKVIEILEHLELPLKTAQDHDNHLAVRIGAEAVKREQERRHSIYWSGAALLPGETEE